MNIFILHCVPWIGHTASHCLMSFSTLKIAVIFNTYRTTLARYTPILHLNTRIAPHFEYWYGVRIGASSTVFRLWMAIFRHLQV
jgi:hypothetical protein